MKRLSILLIAFMIVPFGAADAFEDFSYAPVQDGQLQLDMTGGETRTIQANFTNTVDQSLPLVIDVHIDDDREEPVEEAAFQVDGAVDGQDLETRYDNETWTLYDVSVAGNDRYATTIDITSNIRLAPGTYDVSIDIKTEQGIASATENVEANGSATVSVGTSSEVTLNAGSNQSVNASVSEYSEITVSAPNTNQQLIGAVGVESKNDADLSGEVVFTYDELGSLDPASVQVYHYDQGAWTAVPTDHDPQNRVIRADAAAFSMYAAFGEEPQDEETEDDDTTTNTGSLPNAEAGPNQTIPLDETVTLDAGETEDANSYEWQIDGTELEGETVQYTFETTGQYEARLIAYNEDGTDRDSATITVTEPATGPGDDDDTDDQETPDEETDESDEQDTTEDDQTDDTGQAPEGDTPGLAGAIVGNPVPAAGGLVFVLLLVGAGLYYRYRD